MVGVTDRLQSAGKKTASMQAHATRAFLGYMVFKVRHQIVDQPLGW